jgi:Bacterial regulatory proteins, lacI family
MTHGTPSGWRHHGCRCAACHQALLHDARLTWALRRIRVGADPATRVPAGYVRRHLHKLEAAGLARTRIAQRAGVSAATISRLADPRTRRISRVTANAVMAVLP